LEVLQRNHRTEAPGSVGGTHDGMDPGWVRGKRIGAVERTGIGYGDGDDATVLDDMRGNYLSVYLRQRFILEDPAQIENMILEIAYDDGYVAYLNGEEIGRSENMENRGYPPTHNRNSSFMIE